MAATYATLADLRARFPYRQISSTSNPTDTQVQKWLDIAQAKLDGVLREVIGIPTPVTDSDAVLILGDLILKYAHGRIRRAYAEANGELGEFQGDDPLVVAFEQELDKIRTEPSLAGAQLNAGGSDPARTPSVRSYFSSAANTDEGFDPIFRRDRGPFGEGNF